MLSWYSTGKGHTSRHCSKSFCCPHLKQQPTLLISAIIFFLKKVFIGETTNLLSSIVKVKNWLSQLKLKSSLLIGFNSSLQSFGTEGHNLLVHKQGIRTQQGLQMAPIGRDLFPTLSHIQTLVWNNLWCMIPTRRHRTLEMQKGHWELRTGFMIDFRPALLTIIWLIDVISRIWFEMCFGYSLMVTLWGAVKPSPTSNLLVTTIIYQKEPKN